MSSRFKIARLGAQGDGVAETPTGQVFIPFALPGEEVTAARVKDRAELISVLEVSPDRIAPGLPSLRRVRRVRHTASEE
jgi:23S rRNA (uracil1939-C5)-methyltransferase